MTDWSIEDVLDAWNKKMNDPELCYDRESDRVFHEVCFKGRSLLRWRPNAIRPIVVFEDVTNREEAVLRQQLSNPSLVTRQPAIEGQATVSLRERSDLDVIVELLTSRVEGKPVTTGETFASQWSEFIYWADRFLTWPEFDEHERDYKLKIAANLDNARQSLADEGDDWQAVLKRAFQSPNNLTSWRMHSVFLAWCQQEPELARTALNLIWEPREPRRIRTFLQIVPTSVVGGTGLRLSLASFLQMGIDPYALPFYRATLFSRGFELTGFEPPVDGTDEQGTYDHALVFLDRIAEEARARNLDLRDRLDAQSILWAVAVWGPVETWSDDDKQRFHSFRGDVPA